MSGATRWLLALAGIVALALFIGVLVTALGEGEQEFTEGSAEATLQDYFHAVADGDASAALGYLSEEARERCSEIPPEFLLQRGENTFRARVIESAARGESVAVDVGITETNGGVFGGGDSESRQVFILIQEGGQWRFAQAPWPLGCFKPNEGARQNPVTARTGTTVRASVAVLGQVIGRTGQGAPCEGRTRTATTAGARPRRASRHRYRTGTRKRGCALSSALDRLR